MHKSLIYIILIESLFTLLILQSCSISNDAITGNNFQKRKYNKGYHTNFSKAHKNSNKNTVSHIDYILDEDYLLNNQDIFADNSNQIEVENISYHKLDNTQNQDTLNNCDKLLLYDNEVIECVITEINSSEIKYKSCNQLNDQEFVIEREYVKLIKYKNGNYDINYENRFLKEDLVILKNGECKDVKIDKQDDKGITYSEEIDGRKITKYIKYNNILEIVQSDGTVSREDEIPTIDNVSNINKFGLLMGFINLNILVLNFWALNPIFLLTAGGFFILLFSVLLIIAIIKKRKFKFTLIIGALVGLLTALIGMINI